MYRKYFGLRKAPFSIAPDPRYLFMSEQHREALAHLFYGVKQDGGFVLLTGEVGTGKTTICRRLLEKLPKSCTVAFVINPRLSVAELLAAICDEFRIRYPKTRASVKTFVDLINAYLLEAHARRRKALLIIDEAQHLSDEVLEQIRLLTNLETNERKLLQIILLGQPELRDNLARPELRQLAQRIVARYHLGPLSKSEVALYVNHRLTVAGMRRELFTPSSLTLLYGLSGGIPRVINAICDRAMLGAYVQEKNRVDKATLAKAAREVWGAPLPRENGYRKVAGWLVAGAMLALAGVLWAFLLFQQMRPSASAKGPAPGEKEAAPASVINPVPKSDGSGTGPQTAEAPRDSGKPSARAAGAANQQGPDNPPAEPGGKGPLH